MGKNGSNYHPARISGQAKRIMERESNKQIEESKIKSKIKPININKPDWTIKEK